MTGREIFAKYKSLINKVELSYSLLPKPVQGIVYRTCFNDRAKLLLRYFNLRQQSNYIGTNVYIAENTIIKNTKLLNIGNNFSIHEFSYIDAIGGIDIGDNVSIAHNCSLVSFEHTWTEKKVPIKYNPTKNQSIKIGNDVWIGCGVRILSGAIIEDRVIVAAGSVVVKGTLKSGYIYGGIPAKKIKSL